MTGADMRIWGISEMKTTLSIRALLSSALVAAPVVILAPAIASADDGNKQWYSHGDVEVGTNIFIDEPSSGFGLVPGTNLFLTPRNRDRKSVV